MNIRIIIISIVLIALNQNIIAQNCIRGISTNPQNPINTELNSLFPGKINPWINSFDFGAYQGATFDPIYLNPTAGWQIDDWTNLTQIPMQSPFTLGGAAGGSYLVTPSIPFQNRDFHWEDGWELLYLGTGYYPNGERIDSINTNRIITQSFAPKNTRVPYMIYYNRYSAKIRLFVGLFADFGDFQSANVDLSISGGTTSSNDVTGIFRHLLNYDTPLDKNTEITKQSGVNTLANTQSSNNIYTWYTFDFQVAYDPCTCNTLTNLDFVFQAVDSSEISLYGRQITLDENLTDADGNPIYDDGFLSVQDVRGNAESGYIFRDKLSNLVDDYNTSLDTYNQQMEDKEFGKLGWFRDILDDVREQAIGAAVDFIPGGQIASFLVDKNLTLGADSSNTESAINNGGKALLGQGYDFLSNQIFGENVDPVRPSIPAASFTEMRFSGSVTTDNYIPLNGFINPGSDFAGSDLTPFNYPSYNEILGLYATLRTPEVEVLKVNSNVQTIVNSTVVDVDSSDFDDNFSPDYTRVDSTIWKTKKYGQKLFLKLKEPLEYALNKAVDIDTTNTKIYVSFDVKLETEDAFNGTLANIQRIDSIRYEFSENTNLWAIHDISAGIYPGNLIKRKIELVSGWYDVKDVTNLLFGSNFYTSVYYSDLYEKDYVDLETPLFQDEFRQEIPSVLEDNLKYRPVRITMKVMADMYFDQLSFTGEKINTTQVFTYLLLDEASGIDIISDQDNYIPSDSMISYVNMYPGELTILSNILFPGSPEILLSNYLSFPFSIYADRIIVNDSLGGLNGSNGSLYNLEAYTEIKLKPGTHLSSNLKLGIKRDVYDGLESVAATSNELSTFCQSNDYNSGTLSRKAKNVMEERLEKIIEHKALINNDELKNQIYLSPNPAKTLIRITSSTNPISEIQIFDLSGRSVIHKKTGNDIRQVELDINNLQSGVYIVQTRCGDEHSSEKLVVSK